MTVELRQLKQIELEVTALKQRLANHSPASVRRLLETRRAQMLHLIEATSVDLRIARQEAAHILLEAVRRSRFTPASLAAAAVLMAVGVLAALVIRDPSLGLGMMLLGAALYGLPLAIRNVAQSRLNREAVRRGAGQPSLGTVIL